MDKCRERKWWMERGWINGGREGVVDREREKGMDRERVDKWR